MAVFWGAVGIFSRRTKALRGGTHPGAPRGTPSAAGGARESCDSNNYQVLDIFVAKTNKVTTIIKPIL